MKSDLKSISMTGRMAYVIMCVEKYCIFRYPNKKWTILSEKMWKATSQNWGDWPDEYCEVIPDYLLNTDYNKENYEFISEREYCELMDLYKDITTGNEEDISDEVNYMINKPYEMAMVYEGTGIGDGEDSFRIIENTEKILLNNNIELPDFSCLKFSSVLIKNGWGEPFEGERFSIIINGIF